MVGLESKTGQMLDLRSLHKFSASGGFVPPHVNNAVLWPDVARLCGSLPSWEVPSSVLWWRRFLRWSVLHQLALSRPCWKLSQRFRYSSSNYLPHAMALYCLGSFVTRKGHLMDTLFGVTNAVFQRGRNLHVNLHEARWTTMHLQWSDDPRGVVSNDLTFQPGEHGWTHIAILDPF